MDLAGAVLVALLALPAHPDDRLEGPAARAERLGTLAEGIAEAAERATCSGTWRSSSCRRIWPRSSRTLAALLVTLGFYESGFSSRIQAGRCRPLECDRGRARGVFQIHATGPVTVEEWRGMVGSSSSASSSAAWGAARIAAGAAHACREQGNAGIVAGYATGSRCEWSPAAARVRKWIGIESKIRLALR